MRIEYIQSFQIDKNVTFTGAMVAIEGTKAFMIQKCGYILLTDCGSHSQKNLTFSASSCLHQDTGDLRISVPR